MSDKTSKNEVSKFMFDFDETPVSVCPTCNTLMTDFNEYIGGFYCHPCMKNEKRKWWEDRDRKKDEFDRKNKLLPK
jgi:hypothetical protein